MRRRNGSLMSEALKYELAKEMGVHDTVQQEGWGSVPSRMCGSLVSLAIARAERSVQAQNR
jgi:small acid-soluble spore protein F (minor alpha/beta-type SASP)